MTDQQIIDAIEWLSAAAPNGQWGVQANVGHFKRGGPKPVGVAVTLPTEPTEGELSAVKTNLERAIVARWHLYNPSQD